MNPRLRRDYHRVNDCVRRLYGGFHDTAKCARNVAAFQGERIELPRRSENVRLYNEQRLISQRRHRPQSRSLRRPARDAFQVLVNATENELPSLRIARASATRRLHGGDVRVRVTQNEVGFVPSSESHWEFWLVPLCNMLQRDLGQHTASAHPESHERDSCLTGT